jgi:hypothetical protein
MDIDYWNRFLRSGSVEDYLHYRQCLSQAGQEIIKEVANGKSTVKSERSSTPRASNEGEL